MFGKKEILSSIRILNTKIINLEGGQDCCGHRIEALDSKTQNRIDRCGERIEALEESLVECEVCGCLLRKGSAVRGESVIDRDEGGDVPYGHRDGASLYDILTAVPPTGMETIREVWYCKVHQPKKGKK